MEDKGNGTREFLKSVVLTEILKCSTFRVKWAHVWKEGVWNSERRYKIQNYISWWSSGNWKHPCAKQTKGTYVFWLELCK